MLRLSEADLSGKIGLLQHTESIKRNLAAYSALRYAHETGDFELAQHALIR